MDEQSDFLHVNGVAHISIDCTEPLIEVGNRRRLIYLHDLLLIKLFYQVSYHNLCLVSVQNSVAVDIVDRPVSLNDFHGFILAQNLPHLKQALEDSFHFVLLRIVSFVGVKSVNEFFGPRLLESFQIVYNFSHVNSARPINIDFRKPLVELTLGHVLRISVFFFARSFQP